MPKLSNVSPADLAIGDIIIDRNDIIPVKKLEWCPSHTKGVRRIHVNDSQCWDGVATIEVVKSGAN
jgi:hypothetical protein